MCICSYTYFALFIPLSLPLSLSLSPSISISLSLPLPLPLRRRKVVGKRREALNPPRPHSNLFSMPAGASPSFFGLPRISSAGIGAGESSPPPAAAAARHYFPITSQLLLRARACVPTDDARERGGGLSHVKFRPSLSLSRKNMPEW